jgi:hypothetical protein
MLKCSMRRALIVLTAVPYILLAVSCDSQGPVGPGSSALDQFVEGLRRQGLTVSLAGEIRPEVSGFFSVPATQVRVNAAQVNAYQYPSDAAAATEAGLISDDGQPSPTARVSWVSTPRFYRQGSLIVLYVGCSTEIVQALQATVGSPIAVGRTPCNMAG